MSWTNDRIRSDNQLQPMSTKGRVSVTSVRKDTVHGLCLTCGERIVKWPTYREDLENFPTPEVHVERFKSQRSQRKVIVSALFGWIPQAFRFARRRRTCEKPSLKNRKRIGDFMYRRHEEFRIKLHVPTEETYTIPRKYVDVMRQTQRDISGAAGHTVNDY